jgi:hypothetical protein
MFTLQSSSDNQHLGVAHLEERVLWEHEVAGSSPVTETVESRGMAQRKRARLGDERSRVRSPLPRLYVASTQCRRSVAGRRGQIGV